MRHVIKIDDSFPVEAIVETTESKVSLTLAFHDEDDDVEHVAVLLSPPETAKLAVALQAAAWHHIGARGGDQTS